MAKAPKGRQPRVYAGVIDGVHEWVVAAPNQRAALDAWGVHQDLFAQGVAHPAEDEAAIEAARARPGEPLRRRAGTKEPFRPASEDPAGAWAAALEAAPKGRAKPAPKPERGGAATLAPELPRAAGNTRRAPAPPPAAPAPRTRPAPASARRKAPDRRPLMQAEAALKAFDREEQKALGEIERERAALDRREKTLRVDLEKRREALERAVKRARASWEAALGR